MHINDTKSDAKWTVYMSIFEVSQKTFTLILKGLTN